jgi:hypothetical protein
MNVGVHPVDLLMDIGSTHSVVTQPMGLLSQRHATIVRDMGDQTHHPFFISRKCNLEKHELRHKFSLSF